MANFFDSTKDKDTEKVKTKGFTLQSIHENATPMASVQSFQPQSARQQLMAQQDYEMPLPGSNPSASDFLSRIMTVAKTDKAKGETLFNQFITCTQDPSTPLYNPYMFATNKAVSEIQKLGISVPASGITSQWLEQNRGLLNNARYTTTGDSPAAPTTKSTREQNAAYWYYQILKDEERTLKAEQEWKALQEEISYWVNRYDRSYSDQEILDRIDWSNYKTLAAMDDTIDGRLTPLSLNRSIGYSKDNLYGAIWAARNNSTTGNALADSVQYRLGVGDSYYANDYVVNRRTADSGMYNPYAVGSSPELDDAALYFGEVYFDKDWLDRNRAMISGNDKTMRKMYNKVYEAEQTTVAAETELEQLHKDIDYWMETIHNPDDIIDILYSSNDYKTLQKLDASLKSGKLLATTRAIDYSRQDIEAMIRDRCKEFSDQEQDNVFAQDVADTLGITPVTNDQDDAINQEKNDQVQKTAPYIAKNGTEAEKDIYKYAYTYNWDNYMNMFGTAITDGTLPPQEAYDKHIAYTNQYACKYYFDANQTVRQYEAAQNNQAALAEEVDRLQKAYDEALQKRGGKDPTDYTGMTPDEVRMNLLITYKPDPEEGEIAAARTALQDAENRQRDNDKYLQTNAKKYEDAQKQLKKIEDSYDFAARIANLAGVEQTEEEVWETRSMLDLIGNFAEAPAVPEINSYSAYDFALSQGQSQEEVTKFAKENSLSYIAGIGAVDQILDWIKTNNVKVDDVYLRNLEAQKAIYEDQVKDTAYFTLRNQDDFNNVVSAFKQEMSDYWNGLDWIKKSFGEKDYTDHALALIDPTLAGADMDSMVELSGNASRRGNILAFTPEEQNTYLYIYAKEGKEAAEQYFDYLQDRVNARMGEQSNQVIMDMFGGKIDGGWDVINGTLGTILASPLRIIGSLYSIKQLATGEEINPRHWAYSWGNTMDQIRSESKDYLTSLVDDEALKAIMSFGYDAVTSAGDSIYSATLGKAIGLTSIFNDKSFAGMKQNTKFTKWLADWLPKGMNSFMGATLQGSYAIGSTAQDLSLRGVRDAKDIALITGVGFLVESLTEAIEVSDILGIDDAATFKSLWKGGNRIKAALKGLQGDEALGEAFGALIEGLSEQYLDDEFKKYDIYTEDGFRQLLNDVLYSAAMGMVSGEISHLATAPLRRKGKGQNQNQQNQNTPQNPPNGPTNSIDTDENAETPADLSDMAPEETDQQQETGLALTTPSRPQPTIDFDYGMKVKTENGEKTLIGLMDHDGSEVRYVTEDGEIVSQKEITGMEDADLQEVNRILAQESVTETLQEAHDILESNKAEYNSLLGQRAPEPQGPMLPGQQQIENDRRMIALRQQTLLQMAQETNDPASRTAAIASVLAGGNNDLMHNQLVTAAAINFMKQHGDIQKLSEIWLSSTEAGIDNDLFRTAMAIAMSTDGDANLYLERMMGRDYTRFSKEEINGLIRRAMMDIENPDLTDRLRARINELSTAQEEKRLIGDGALSGTESAKQAMDNANANAAQAAEQAEAAERTAQEAAENVKVTTQQMLDNPSDGNLVGASKQAIKDAEGKRIVADQMQQSKDNADEQANNATEAYNSTYDAAMKDVREQAAANNQAAVEAEQQAREEQSEQEALQAQEDARKNAKKGHTGQVTDSEGNTQKFHYEVVDARAIEMGEIDEEGQKTVAEIAGGIKPQKMMQGATPEEGAPLLNADYTVVDGNKRLAGIQQAKNEGHGLRYTGWLKMNASQYGFTPSDVNSNTVLVRVLDGPVQEQSQPSAPVTPVTPVTQEAPAASEAPETQTAPETPAEQPAPAPQPEAEQPKPKKKAAPKKTKAQPTQMASQDQAKNIAQAEADSSKLSKKIIGLFTRFSDSGKVGSKGNVKFVKGFLSLVDPSERAGLLEKDPVTGKTHLNDEGERRMISALFHRAYGKANTDNTKNMSKRYANSSVAMVQMAPAVALLNANTEEGEVYNYDLGKKLNDAAAIIKNLGNLTVEEYLEQPDFSTDDGNSTIDPVTAELARMLYRDGNHADRLVKDIQSIVDAIYEQGKPDDGKTAPDAVQLIQNALGLDLEDGKKGKSGKSKAIIGGGNGGTTGGQGSTTNGPVRNSPYRIAKNLAHAIGVGEYFDQLVDRHIRQNERDTQGYYQARIDYVTSRPTAAGNVYEPFHELGHAIAARIGLTGTPQMVNTLRQMAANGQTNLNVNAYTNAQLADEAFAEFFYRYISDPQLARQFAGDVFTDQFEQLLRSNDLYDAVHEAGTEVQLFLNADVNRQIGAVIKDRSEVERKPIFQRLRGLIPKIVDASSAAEQINHEIRQQTGGQGPEMSADVRARALQRNFAARRVDYILTQNLTDPDGNVVGRSLAGALAPLNGKDDFDLYIRYGLAKHAVDRHDNGRLVLSEDIWGADGRSVQDFIDDVERNHHNIAEAFENFQQWRNDFLQTWMVDTGFMTQETLDRLNQMYPYYVPTFRVNGKGFTGRIQHTTGSTQDIINTMDSWIDMVSQIVEMNMKNRVAVAFHNAYSTYENMGHFGAMIEGFGENEPLRTSDEIIDGLTNGTLGHVRIDGLSQTNRTNTSDTICAVLPDGRRVYYQVNDRALHDLLAGTGSKVDDTYNMASKSVGILTRAMSKLTTGSNPLFAVSNALRDFQNSVNYGSWASNYLTGLFRWFRAMGEVIGNSAKFQEYTAQGGGGWTRIDTSDEGATNDIRNRLVPGYHNESLAHRAWNILTLDRVNEIVEQTSRFAEYRFGRQNDTDTLEGRQRAFLAAQEATTDFARQGNTKLLNTLGQIIPFLKAATQGVYRFGRMFTEAERGRLAPRLAKTIFNTALASALANMALLSFGDDDEKEDFINMSDDYKTGFFTLPNFAPDILGNRDLIRIPLAQDPIVSAVHSYITNAMWKGSTDQFAIDMMSIADAVKDNVNPFNNPVWSAFNDIQMNRNWYGSKIVPTRLEGLDSSDRYTETTPDAFIGLSRGLNAGLDTLGYLGADVDTAKDMVSPLNLQYIAQQYTGFLGQMVLPSISKDKHTGNIVGIMGAVNAARNRFTVDPTVSSKLTSAFYDNKTWLEQITKTASAGKPLNVLRRGLSQEEANQAVADAKAMTSKGGVIKTSLDTINGLYDEIDDIMANDTISDADKNTLIKEKRRAINAAALEANEAAQEYREKYVTGRSLATSALYEGALANPESAKAPKKSNADTLPQTFRDDAEKDYMKKAQAVYQATGKDSALPHPSYSFSSEGKEYTVDEASRARYDTEYKKAYLDYLNTNKVFAKWDSMDDKERLKKMQGAHNSATSKAKEWYIKQHR